MTEKVQSEISKELQRVLFFCSILYFVLAVAKLSGSVALMVIELVNFLILGFAIYLFSHRLTALFVVMNLILMIGYFYTYCRVGQIWGHLGIMLIGKGFWQTFFLFIIGVSFVFGVILCLFGFDGYKNFKFDEWCCENSVQGDFNSQVISDSQNQIESVKSSKRSMVQGNI